MLSLLHHYILSKSKDFEKVYKTDNQLLLGSIMYGRFANAPQEKLLGQPLYNINNQSLNQQINK